MGGLVVVGDRPVEERPREPGGAVRVGRRQSRVVDVGLLVVGDQVTEAVELPLDDEQRPGVLQRSGALASKPRRTTTARKPRAPRATKAESAAGAEKPARKPRSRKPAEAPSAPPAEPAQPSENQTSEA